MSAFIPNRVSVGKAGAGRFDFKRNSEADLELEDDLEAAPVDEFDGYELPVVESHDDAMSENYRDWRVVTKEAFPHAETVKEWDDLNDRLSDNIRGRQGRAEDIDRDLESNATLIKAADDRAVTLLADRDNHGEFSKEYLDGLTSRLSVGVVRNNREELQKITWPAYDKIEELNKKIAEKPDSPYVVKWEREADAQRRTAILARNEIMRLNEEERNAN